MQDRSEILLVAMDQYRLYGIVLDCFGLSLDSFRFIKIRIYYDNL